MLFYTLAAGRLTLDAPLRRFLRGELGALQTAVSCTTPNEAARWWGQPAGNVVRVIQVVLTQNSGPGRFVMHRGGRRVGWGVGGGGEGCSFEVASSNSSVL